MNWKLIKKFKTGISWYFTGTLKKTIQNICKASNVPMTFPQYIVTHKYTYFTKYTHMQYSHIYAYINMYIYTYTHTEGTLYTEPKIPYYFHSIPIFIALTKKSSIYFPLPSTKFCQETLGIALIHKLIVETQAQLCK